MAPLQRESVVGCTVQRSMDRKKQLHLRLMATTGQLPALVAEQPLFPKKLHLRHLYQTKGDYPIFKNILGKKIVAIFLRVAFISHYFI